MEHARVRGALWFWSSLLRTMAALLLRSFAVEPRKFAWIGFLGALRVMGLGSLAALAAVLGFSVTIGFTYGLFGPPRSPNWPLRLADLMIYGAPALVLYRTSRWAARRAPGRELTAGLTLFAELAMLGALSSVFPTVGSWVGSWVPSLNGLSVFAADGGALVLSLAGATSARSQAAAR